MKVVKFIDAKPMLDAFFKELFDTTNTRIMQAARHGVSEALNLIRDKTKSNISSSWFNATTSAGRTLRGRTYTVPLIEGVRAYMWSGVATGSVNIMGSRNEDDGTWRLRFFEGGTRVRKSKNGRTYGQIRPTWFFGNAIASVGSDTVTEIEKSIQHAIDEINNANL